MLYPSLARAARVRRGEYLRAERRIAGAQRAEELDVVGLARENVGEFFEKDLLILQWTSGGGKFVDERQTRDKAWQAPNEPGQYKISITTSLPRGSRRVKLYGANLTLAAFAA